MAENASDNAIAIGRPLRTSEGLSSIPSTLVNCILLRDLVSLFSLNVFKQ